MTCKRCGGLLVQEMAVDMVIWQRQEMTKCVNCGNFFDEVSRHNFLNPDRTPKMKGYRGDKVWRGKFSRENYKI